MDEPTLDKMIAFNKLAAEIVKLAGIMHNGNEVDHWVILDMIDVPANKSRDLTTVSIVRHDDDTPYIRAQSIARAFKEQADQYARIIQSLTGGKQ